MAGHVHAFLLHDTHFFSIQIHFSISCRTFAHRRKLVSLFRLLGKIEGKRKVRCCHMWRGSGAEQFLCARAGGSQARQQAMSALNMRFATLASSESAAVICCSFPSDPSLLKRGTPRVGFSCGKDAAVIHGILHLITSIVSFLLSKTPTTANRLAMCSKTSPFLSNSLPGGVGLHRKQRGLAHRVSLADERNTLRGACCERAWLNIAHGG